MTSAKSSLVKSKITGMQSEYTKRRLWLVAFMALYVIVAYLIFPILYLGQRKQYYSYYGYGNAGTILNRFSAYMQEGAEHLLGFTFYFYGVAVIALAVLFGVQGFMWLYKVSSVDFFESQPIKRSRRFLGMFLNGILIYAIMSFVGVIIGLIVTAGMGAYGKAVLVLALLQWVRLLILFFSVYAITVLSVLISRNVVIAVFVDMLLLSAEALWRELIYFMSTTYYATFYSMRYIFSNAEILHPYPTSPIANHFAGVSLADDLANNDFTGQYIYMTDHMSKVKGQLAAVLPFDAVSLITGVVVFALALIVYHFRKAEAIGSGVIDNRIACAIKLLVAMPLGAFVGLTVDSLFNTTRLRLNPMMILLVAFAVVVLCLVMEVVDSGNIRRIFAHAWQIPTALVLSFALLYFFKLDISEYDRYLPDIDKVEDAVLITNAYDRDYYEKGSYIRYDNEAYLLNHMHLTNIYEVIEVAAIGQKQMVEWCDAREAISRNSSDSMGMSGYYDSPISGWYATIGYHMKDGRLICRNVLIPYDIDSTLMDSIVATDEWRNVVYQPDEAINATAFMRDGVACYNAGYGDVSESLNIPQMKQLLSLYAKDLEKFSFSMASNDDPIGTISIYDNSPDNYMWINYPIYANYSETIRFLDELGIYQEPAIPIDRVISMTIDYSESSDDGMISNYYRYELSDFNDIMAVVSAAKSDITGIWHKYLSEETVGVSFTLQEESDYYPAEWYYTIPLADLRNDIRGELFDNLESTYSRYEEY